MTTTPPRVLTSPNSSRERRGGRLRELKKPRTPTQDFYYEDTPTNTPTKTPTKKRDRRLESLENDNFFSNGKSNTENSEEEISFIKKRGRKKKKGVSQTRNIVKNFQQVIEEEGYEAYPSHVPTYLSVATEPSSQPQRFFCSVCGFIAPYTCTKCAMRFCSRMCLENHKETRCLKWVKD